MLSPREDLYERVCDAIEECGGGITAHVKDVVNHLVDEVFTEQAIDQDDEHGGEA